MDHKLPKDTYGNTKEAFKSDHTPKKSKLPGNLLAGTIYSSSTPPSGYSMGATMAGAGATASGLPVLLLLSPWRLLGARWGRGCKAPLLPLVR